MIFSLELCRSRQCQTDEKMHEEWLMSVLREIDSYASKRGLRSLMALVEAGYEAARKELPDHCHTHQDFSNAAEAADHRLGPGRRISGQSNDHLRTQDPENSGVTIKAYKFDTAKRR